MTTFVLPWKRGAQVALIGMGISNRGVLELLCSRPDLLISLRDRQACPFPESLPFFKPPRTFRGENYLCKLTEDILFLSPSVRQDLPEIIAARQRGAHITTDSAFFFEHTHSRVFAISGSDGKSTTASLAAEILRLMSGRVRLGGNIGAPLSPMLLNEGDFTVAELSSFQLMHKHKPQARALLTNLTPNHLDFHSSLEEYYNVKLCLLSSASEPILNLDDEEICKRLPSLDAFVGYTMRENAQKKRRAEHLYTIKDNTVYLDGAPYLSLAPILHRGRVFIKNLLAALALTHAHHEKTALAEAMSHFRPLAHRRELVRVVNGVSYFDSSVDSSPSRTRETLGDFSSGVVMILGGRSKGVPYGILKEELNQRARAVILTGENAPLIRQELSALCVPMHECDTLADAVALASSIAKSGDSVLLSPASTSFDRFQNFEERGECFKALVRAL